MYQELLNLIECPLCRSKLTLSTAKMSEEEIIEGTLICNEGHRFHLSVLHLECSITAS